MAVALLASAEEFLLQTTQFRAADPYRTNLIGSVATSVAVGSATYENYFWWVVTDLQGHVIGVAMRTAPHGMVLSPMPEEARRELAKSVAIQDDNFPDVAGPVTVVNSFIGAYAHTDSTGSSRQTEIEGRQLLYALNELRIPNIQGAMVDALADDFDLLLEWYLEFGTEAKIMMPNPSASVRSGLQRNGFRFWVVDGEKVCLAGHAPIVETPSGSVGRVGPVYTPAIHRKNGYGSALTARLSQELLDMDAMVMLYTDASNPTSNGIYQRIGFELIDENVKVDFLARNV